MKLRVRFFLLIAVILISSLSFSQGTKISAKKVEPVKIEKNETAFEITKDTLNVSPGKVNFSIVKAGKNVYKLTEVRPGIFIVVLDGAFVDALLSSLDKSIAPHNNIEEIKKELYKQIIPQIPKK